VAAALKYWQSHVDVSKPETVQALVVLSLLQAQHSMAGGDISGVVSVLGELLSTPAVTGDLRVALAAMLVRTQPLGHETALKVVEEVISSGADAAGVTDVAALAAVAVKASGKAVEVELPEAQPVTAGDGDAEAEAEAEAKRARTSKATVLKKRAKARAKYMEELAAKFAAKGLPVPHPDPERWLPRKKRGWRRKGKARYSNTGASQGSGANEATMRRLDAARREAEGDAPGTRSTARRAVTKKNRRRGRR
jgi:hypothetical protein